MKLCVIPSIELESFLVYLASDFETSDLTVWALDDFESSNQIPLPHKILSTLRKMKVNEAAEQLLAGVDGGVVMEEMKKTYTTLCSLNGS